MCLEFVWFALREVILELDVSVERIDIEYISLFCVGSLVLLPDIFHMSPIQFNLVN